jgi:SAM-dependent methyltransferase
MNPSPAATEEALVHTPEQVLAMALAEPHTPFIVEKDCGCTSTVDLNWWLRTPGATLPPDVSVLDTITGGPVLDVGCGTGRHTELLCERGIDAHGIDTCPTALTLARAAGVPCELADVWTYRPRQRFAYVVALGGNLGLTGRNEQLPAFLRLLASHLRPGGTLILSSTDWRDSTDPHTLGHDPQAVGAYGGDGQRRLHHGNTASHWFDWLRADRDHLRDQAEQNGLHLTQILNLDHSYIAWLTPFNREANTGGSRAPNLRTMTRMNGAQWRAELGVGAAELGAVGQPGVVVRAERPVLPGGGHHQSLMQPHQGLLVGQRRG